MARILSDLLEPDLGVVHVGPEATVREAAKAMASVNVGCVCVLSEGSLVGLFTERDILKRVLLEDLHTDGVKVSEVMTRDIVSARPDQPVSDGMRLMHEHHIRHLPLLEDGGRVLGVVSIRDLMREDLREARRTVDSVRDFIQEGDVFGG